MVVHGRDERLQQLTPLRAGPLTAALDGVDLRYVKHGELELVRRIYVAVRDRNWNTIPGTASHVEVDSRPDAFAVHFRVRHASPDTDFAWDGAIVGTPEGRITFTMDGRGARDMSYNRIGFCVLHPWRETAGRPFRCESPAGTVEGTLPLLVAPQRFEDGVYVPLVPSSNRLEIELERGGSAVFEFEGDLFETEDQRNWTDASFKTYCTPLSLGFPHQLKKGQPKTQAVTAYARRLDSVAAARPTLALELGSPTGTLVPPVGVVLAADAPLPSAAETRLLRVLGSAHVRFDLHLGDHAWAEALARALATARALDAQLELAVFLGPEADQELARLRTMLAAAEVARLLVAPEGAQTVAPDETTPPQLVRFVRERLGLAGVPVAGGTDMYFCELNRTRPTVLEMDGVFWSLNAQVHAFDDVSLMETPEAQGEQVRAAREFAGGKQLFVGPVTLKRRFNVNATVAEGEATGELPDSVDPRQASLIGAAWTLASAKHLAEQGTHAVTYFEAVGWRGVIQGDQAPPLPHSFPARAGQALPLFHILADISSLRGRQIVACAASRPLDLAGLAVRDDAGTTMLLANLTPSAQPVELAELDRDAHVRRLNEATAEQAMSEPEQFRAGFAPLSAGGLTLAPYETVRIDSQRRSSGS